jgi:hypothetical protein
MHQHVRSERTIGKDGRVGNGVEFIYGSCGHAKCIFDDRSGDVADSAVVVAVDA